MTEITLVPAPASRHDRHFRTDHLLSDLNTRSVRGGAVTLAAQGLNLVLQIGSTIFLARLLNPADFGLVAMVATVTGLAMLFRDLGLSQATIQCRDVTHAQVSTLFWINVSVSALLGAVVIALAPAVAWFYGEPALKWITVALGGTFVFGGISAQHTALLRRQMRFVPLAVIDITSLVLGIMAALVLALLGASYWALVGMIGVQAIATAAGSWVASGWMPGFPHRRAGVRPMLRFGGHLTGFSVLNYSTRNLDNILIGAVLGPGPLGMYSRAYNLLMLPIRQINAPITAVVSTALSRLQHDPEKFRRYYLSAVRGITLLGMPIVAFAFVETDNVILLVLGSGWSEVVSIFRCLAPAALVGTFNVAPGWLFESLGRTDRLFRWGLLSAPITSIGFIIGLAWGPAGVAAAFSITFCTLYVALIVYASMGTPVTAIDSFRAILPALLASAAAGTGLALVRPALGDNAFVQVFLGGVIFGLMYLVCVVVAGGRRWIRDASALFTKHGKNNERYECLV